MSIREKIIQLDSVQRRLGSNFRRTPLGQLYTERTDEEITKEIKEHKCLYQLVKASGDPMHDYVQTDYYEQQLKKTKIPLTIAEATRHLMRTFDFIASMKVYGDNDYNQALCEYFEEYAEFCERWPHLKDALPLPQDVYNGWLPQWASSERPACINDVIVNMMYAIDDQDTTEYQQHLDELWFQWPEFMQGVPSGFEVIALMKLPKRLELFVSNLLYTIEDQKLTIPKMWRDAPDLCAVMDETLEQLTVRRAKAA